MDQATLPRHLRLLYTLAAPKLLWKTGLPERGSSYCRRSVSCQQSPFKRRYVDGHHQLDHTGLIAGFIGSKIVNKQGQGFWLNIALGIVGAVVGGFLFDLLGATGVTGLNIYSMIVAIIGSIVVLLIYNALTGRRA